MIESYFRKINNLLRLPLHLASVREVWSLPSLDWSCQARSVTAWQIMPIGDWTPLRIEKYIEESLEDFLNLAELKKF